MRGQEDIRGGRCVRLGNCNIEDPLTVCESKPRDDVLVDDSVGRRRRMTVKGECCATERDDG